MPTDSYGNSCLTLGTPYINNCNYDAAGELLNWIYGPLNARNSGALSGRFIAFDQSEFIALPSWHGMADFGYLYVPPPATATAQAANCTSSSTAACKTRTTSAPPSCAMPATTPGPTATA
jgi:hypothetical protein